MDEDYAHPKLTTPEQVAGYLALKHANGASMAQILEWHTEILLRIAEDYVWTWDDVSDFDHPDSLAMMMGLHNGALFVVNHLYCPDEWYRDE